MAKFKVGDKVRVREDLVINEVYEDYYFNKEMSALKGKVIKIRRAEENGYNLEGNNWFWTDKMLVEVKEDKMEKTFKEVIANIKEGEVWESVQSCFQLKEISCLEGRIQFKFEGVFVDKTDRGVNVDTGVGNGQTFKLQRKEYTFQEAFKAYEEGKEIESCEGNKFKMVREYKVLVIDFAGQKIEFNDEADLFSIKEIKGKWYIND